MIIKTSHIQKPEYFVPIDWSNPLTKGLKIALVANERSGLTIYNLADKSNNATDVGGTGLWDINNNGRFWSAPDNTFGGDGLTITTPPFSGTESRTVICGQTQTTNPANNDHICQAGTSASGTKWSFKYQTASSDVLRIEISGSGYNSSLIPGLGYHVMGVCFEGTQLQDHRFFLDGVFEQATGTNSVNTGIAQYDISHSTVGNTNRCDDEIDFHYAWNRKLSDAEFLAIEANPWQILQPLRRYVPMYIAPVVGVSGKSNPLYGPFGGPLAGVLA